MTNEALLNLYSRGGASISFEKRKETYYKVHVGATNIKFRKIYKR